MAFPGSTFSRIVKRIAHRRPIPEVHLRIVNLSRGTELANSALLADKGETRRKGLLGRECLAEGEGLWIVPCEGVHTVGMKFPIDLAYLDRRHLIKKIKCAVKPWRLSVCLSAHSVLELPSGTLHKTFTQAGDRIELSAVSAQGTKLEYTDRSARGLA